MSHVNKNLHYPLSRDIKKQKPQKGNITHHVV